MKTFLRTFLFFMLAISLAGCSSKTKDENSVKNWAWLAGDSDMPADQLDNYFKNAKDCGIDAILLQVHGGYPKGMEDTSDFTDYDAIKILENAVPVAKKYGIELHAWMWTINRCEKNLRAAHPDWYMVNANDTSCLDIKLYNREHYRWLCPSRPETLEYLKARVAELAKIDGVAGVHLDFIRYPDAILPYGLHESRGVVQDKVYPHWDHCYCEHCRAEFEKLTGIDPMELEDEAGYYAALIPGRKIPQYRFQIKRAGKTAGSPGKTVRDSQGVSEEKRRTEEIRYQYVPSGRGTFKRKNPGCAGKI